MKHILRTLAVICLLGVMMPEASAQVSVRRGGSSRSESSAPKKKDKDKKSDSKKSDAKTPDERRTPALSAASGREGAPTEAGKRPTPATGNAPVVNREGATPARRPAAKKEAPVTVDGNSQRQQSFAEYQRKQDGYIPWQHVVYRELDLTKEKNASLYFPQEPQDGLTNLFRVIFEAFCSGRLKGYEYMDGREIFDKKYEVKVQDVLDKFSVYYQQKPGVGKDAPVVYQVEEMDVPSNEVLRYYIKERWEFDQKTSKYGPRILAICPILLRAGDFGGDAVPYPMFWINYEDLRPFLRDHLVMSDGMNNTPRFTMEEYFTLQQYEGDIYKVQNTRGLSLMQQYPNADTLKIMREKIELQLRGFGDSIWIHEPTDAELAAQDSIKAAQRAERRARRANDDRRPAPATEGKRNRRTKEAVDMEAVADAQEAKAEEIDKRVEQTGTAHSAKRSARRSR